MSSQIGEKLKVSVFGQSHSEAIGVVIDGLPAGFKVDSEKLYAFLARRAPGSGAHTTSRKEADLPKFISGLVDWVTCGSPICAIIENTNTRSKDYENLRETPRPGHADYTAYVKYGMAHDIRGGGHFSGRLTACLCIAGGICLQYLESKGINIAAHVSEIAGVSDKPFNPISPELSNVLSNEPIAVLDKASGEKMMKEILRAKEELDSVGGVIECAAVGVPAGIGEPMFDGIENNIAKIVFGVPAVKGIEFGAGFASARMCGSECNDEFETDGERVTTLTNNHGGALGGISSGMPIIFRAAIKPTPSIAKTQRSVSLSKGENSTLEISGRHDPCIVPRAVPVMEAVMAIAICNMMI